MIELLAKLFLKKDGEKNEREQYGYLCSGAGIGFNVLLFAVKFIAGTLSGAISVTADAFNNLADSGSSVITLLGFRLAGRKPDPSHPFGHGRIEYLSGLAVSVLIIIMGVELLTSSVKKIFSPEPVETSLLVFIILGISVAVKLYMFAYNRRYGKKYDSAAMLATSSDSISDAVSTAVVFVCMLITKFSGANIDAFAGTAVALFILWAGIKSVYETVQPLLGEKPDSEFVSGIERIVNESSLICGMHDLMVHDYGPGRRIISLHAEVPANVDVLVLHDEIDNVEMRLARELECSATIHLDPVETDNEEVNRLKEFAYGVLKNTGIPMKMHDFRVVTGETHTNLIFDVLVSFSVKKTDDEIRDTVKNGIHEANPAYYAVVTVDRDYAEN